MIPNQWYVVLESKEVGKKPVGVTRLGEKLVFWRDSNQQVHCAFDRCPHRGVQLSVGVVHQDHLQCPFHGFEYDASGQCVLIPAEGRTSQPPAAMRLFTYPTHEAHGFIWIWWGQNPPADLAHPPFFDNLDESFYYGSSIDPWEAHYSRVVENQLDVAHLPFVHYNTIGRGNRTLVDGPIVTWCENGSKMMCTYVFNRVDDGTPPRPASQLTPQPDQVHLELIMPNLWQNHISEEVRVLAAFVPVDATGDDEAAAVEGHERALSGLGRIDLQLLGIGRNGHIAFNEPGSSLGSRTRVKTLTQDTIIANSRFFGGDETKVPKTALTVGVGTVLEAREVVIIVSGYNKARALEKVVEEGVYPSV